MLPNDLVNTKTTIPFRVGEQRLIYTLTLRVSIYISAPLFTSPSGDSCILFKLPAIFPRAGFQERRSRGRSRNHN